MFINLYNFHKSAQCFCWYDPGISRTDLLFSWEGQCIWSFWWSHTPFWHLQNTSFPLVMAAENQVPCERKVISPSGALIVILSPECFAWPHSVCAHAFPLLCDLCLKHQYTRHNIPYCPWIVAEMPLMWPYLKAKRQFAFQRKWLTQLNQFL